MNQKEYELIIKVIADKSCELMEAGVYESLVRAFAYELQDYPSFDKTKFLKSCGVENE